MRHYESAELALEPSQWVDGPAKTRRYFVGNGWSIIFFSLSLSLYLNPQLLIDTLNRNGDYLQQDSPRGLDS